MFPENKVLKRLKDCGSRQNTPTAQYTIQTRTVLQLPPVTAGSRSMGHLHASSLGLRVRGSAFHHLLWH
jgi:hypothetical protein